MSDDVTSAADFIRDHRGVTLGMWLCGGLIDLFLMGGLVAMVSEYWERYRKIDSWVIKGVVLLDVSLGIIRTLQTAATLWYKLIDNFGDYIMAATSSPWYTQYDPLVTVLTCNLVQAFFAARLSGTLRWLLIPITMSILMALGGHIAITVQIHYLSSVAAIALFDKTMYVAIGGLLAADVFITTALSYVLWTSKTGYKRTDNLIWRLLHITWVTAALPAIIELLNMVFYAADLGTGKARFIVFHLMGPRLYSISMLYTLNARQMLKSRDNTIALSTVGNSPSGARVEISREVVHFEDGRRDGPTSVKFNETNFTQLTGHHEESAVDAVKAAPVV